MYAVDGICRHAVKMSYIYFYTWAQGYCDCITANDGMTALAAYRGIHAGVMKNGVKSIYKMGTCGMHTVTAAVKFEIDNSNNKALRNGWDY